VNENELNKLLKSVADGNKSVDEALNELKSGPFKMDDGDLINLDHHRRLRQGLAEVVLAETKTVEQVEEIAGKMSKENYPVLFTRVTDEQFVRMKKKFPSARFNEAGRTLLFKAPQIKNSESGEPYVAILSAGTSDFRTVEEIADVCLAMDVAHEKRNDIGIAGLHRLLKHIPMIQNASAVVVVAGMEGALPSVVGGIASSPVFAVPTSIGYGASFNGIAALLAMLNSCAPGITVVNIDNGFSAGFAACQVIRQIKKYTDKEK
jgi:NCAIR mutase (PurE)-related protein